MTTIQFAHDIGDTVEVVHVKGITGQVASLCRDRNGHRYLVVWWHDGSRKDEWLNDWEIKAVKKT